MGLSTRLVPENGGKKRFSRLANSSARCRQWSNRVVKSATPERPCASPPWCVGSGQARSARFASYLGEYPGVCVVKCGLLLPTLG